MENWTGLFKWVIELSGEAKLVIALLLGLNIYFGITSYSVNEKYDILSDKYNVEAKDCQDRITKREEIWQNRMTIAVESNQKILNDYRDKTESNTKVLNDEIQAKLNEANAKNDRNIEKIIQLEIAYTKLANKIKP